MAAGNFEIGDFDRVGGVPSYARRQVEPDALAANAAYAENPDALIGASSGDDGLVLTETEGDLDIGSGSGEVPDWLSFGDDLLAETAPHPGANRFDDEVKLIPRQAGASADQAHASGDADTDNAPAPDANDEAVVRQPAAAEAAVAAPEDTVAARPDVAEMSAAAPEEDSADTEQQGDIEDDPVRMLATTLDIGLEEARALVEEALTREDPEAMEDPVPAEYADTETAGEVEQDISAEAHETSSEPETTSPKDRVVSFLRKAAAKAGQFTQQEAREFAAGAQVASEEFRRWNDGREDRVNRRALDQARKDIAGGQKKWKKYERHRSDTGTEAPRGRAER